jgi:hypothetical protein
MRAFVGAEPPPIQHHKPVGASFRRIRRSLRVFGRLASLGCVRSSSRPLFLQLNAAPFLQLNTAPPRYRHQGVIESS